MGPGSTAATVRAFQQGDAARGQGVAQSGDQFGVFLAGDGGGLDARVTRQPRPAKASAISRPMGPPPRISRWSGRSAVSKMRGVGEVGDAAPARGLAG